VISHYPIRREAAEPVCILPNGTIVNCLVRTCILGVRVTLVVHRYGEGCDGLLGVSLHTIHKDVVALRLSCRGGGLHHRSPHEVRNAVAIDGDGLLSEPMNFYVFAVDLEQTASPRPAAWARPRTAKPATPMSTFRLIFMFPPLTQ